MKSKNTKFYSCKNRKTIYIEKKNSKKNSFRKVYHIARAVKILL